MNMEHHHHQHHNDDGPAMTMNPSSENAMPDEGQMMSMMRMYFHSGLGDLFLVRNFVLDSPLRLILVCAGVFLFALFLEALDYARGYLDCRCKSSARSSSHHDLVADDRDTRTIQTGSASQDNNTPECCQGFERKFAPRPQCSGGGGCSHSNKWSLPPLKIRLAQAALQFVRTGVSLTLMLVAMTYNVCLIFPIMLGSAVGFYVFHRRGSDVTSVCH